jgi:organic hydroperoxide reductase OsmC/OhrA
LPHRRADVKKKRGSSMSEHRVEVSWLRKDGPFERGNYSSAHEIKISDTQTIKGSPSPAFGGDDSAADPEQLYLSSLSACHMLTFLAVAANRGYVVDSYHDSAVATLSKNAEGKMAVVKVILSPKVEFSGAKRPSADDYKHMQERAHAACFIANSVKTEVIVNV